MGHIVGYVGSVDRVLAATDDAVLRVPGMKVGKAGLELALEPSCAARPAQKGRRSIHAAASSAISPVRPGPGRDVRLTIEARLQQEVLARLAKERQGAVDALMSRPADRSDIEHNDGALPLL